MTTTPAARPFDHADYLANWRKYRLFRTAVAMIEISLGPGRNAIQPGEIVGIVWTRDDLRMGIPVVRMEPVYHLDAGATVYASALGDFVL